MSHDTVAVMSVSVEATPGRKAPWVVAAGTALRARPGTVEKFEAVPLTVQAPPTSAVPHPPETDRENPSEARGVMAFPVETDPTATAPRQSAPTTEATTGERHVWLGLRASCEGPEVWRINNQSSDAREGSFRGCCGHRSRRPHVHRIPESLVRQRVAPVNGRIAVPGATNSR